MDGRQAKLTKSLQFRLAAGLSAIIIALALGAGVFSFRTAFEEANELQDDQLHQVALLIEHYGVPVVPGRDFVPSNGLEPDLQMVVQIAGAPSTQTSARGAGLTLPNQLSNGLQTAAIGNESWRLYAKPLTTGGMLVIAQRTAARDEIARTGALRTVLPLLALVPVLLLLVIVVVRHGLKPVLALSGELDQRPEYDLTALRDDIVPSEIRPFTASINRLLERVARSRLLQQRFIADAAHELRSPLTALSLQAEALGGKDLPRDLENQVGRLRKGLQRIRSLLEQLLTLARFEADPGGARPAAISMLSSLKGVLAEMVPVAEAKRIDLGVVSAETDALVNVRDVELQAIMRNLIENALRYTPAGGRVDVGIHRQGAGVSLVVADSGPGVARAERERVFDAFYRVAGTDTEGSGLGLSIVKTLADRLGGIVSLDDTHPGRSAPGLRVTVRFRVAQSDGE
jgi:two-component system OmpR family sensor kinase